jgi:signal transduction histidine kinase
LLNAGDAMDGQGKVELAARADGDRVRLEVADEGPGIPDADLARVFDPFFTTKPVGQGTGLGLDVARRFVHMHRGDLHFTSQPGRTVFRVRLPVTGADTAPAAPG